MALTMDEAHERRRVGSRHLLLVVLSCGHRPFQHHRSISLRRPQGCCVGGVRSRMPQRDVRAPTPQRTGAGRTALAPRWAGEVALGYMGSGSSEFNPARLEGEALGSKPTCEACRRVRCWRGAIPAVDAAQQTHGELGSGAAEAWPALLG